MNVELLEKVKAAILAKPERFHMGDWGAGIIFGLQELGYEECDATACIAGWAVFLSGEKSWPACGISRSAIKLLDINTLQAEKLFYEQKWPAEFALQYDQAEFNSQPLAMAQAAAARISYFIATNGAE